MDLRKLGAGEALAGLSGVALIAAMALLTWFGVDVPPGTEPVGGFDAFRAFDVIDLLLLLTAIVAIALPLLGLTQPRPDLPIVTSALVALLGIVSAIAVLVRIIIPPDLSGARFALDFEPLNTGFETTRGVGVFIGLLAVIGIATGGWLAMRDERTG
jgi:hypothetical protein